jgi:formylmethanofuran dehydrogenase subunit C
MPLILEWKSSAQPWVDFGEVSIDQLARSSLAEAESFPVWVQGKATSLADYFNVTRRELPAEESEIPAVIAKGDFSRTQGLGTGIRESRLIVDGDAGDAVGARLNGGAIYVLGNAGHQAAEDMKQGLFCVFGDCGENLAGPSSGRLKGMEGGDLIIYGSVGNRAFQRMRRGTAFINGDIGSHVCHQMIAGTVVVMGNIGTSYCQGMRRGTFVASKEANLGANTLFTESKPFELSFLSLLWRHVASVENQIHREITFLGYNSLPRLSIPANVWVHRRIGDLQIDGRGEIITLDSFPH